MGHAVLVAAELKGLVRPADLDGLDVTWLGAGEATPAGDWVALVSLLSRWVGGTEFKNLPKLRVVANCAVGFNNVDLVAAEMRRVIVTNTPDVLTNATADLTWALLLAVARRIPEAVEHLKSGAWRGWHPELLLGLELAGKTLGLFGAGRIGQAVARRAAGFAMRIRYVARSAKPELEAAVGAERVEWGRLLSESDIVSLHAPSTPETKGMVGPEALARIKPSAILINTARGDLVREEPLAIALEEGRLGGAGLDVYQDEPEVHPRLRAAPNVVLLPHIGSATRETRAEMARIALANVRAVLAGAAPLTPVYR